MHSSERARLAALVAEDKKAREIAVLEVRDVTPIADYFVVCSGQSTLQVRAIADAIIERMEGTGHPLRHIEGYEGGRWVLLDYGDVIVHVFLADERDYYGIERLWGDAPRLQHALT